MSYRFPRRELPAAHRAEASEANSAPVSVDAEMIERRRFSRPIPVAHAQELPEAEAWALWDQCTGAGALEG